MVISDDPISVVSDDINITPPIPSGYSSFLDKLKDDMDRIADTTNPMLSNLDRIANKLNTTSTDPMMSNLDKIAEAIENGESESGDLSISEVTLVSSDGLDYSTFVAMAQTDNFDYVTGVTIDENDGFKTTALDLIVNGEPQTVNVIIMPNKYIYAACPPEVAISDFIVTGNAEVDTATEEGTTFKYVKIYGTCSITLVP